MKRTAFLVALLLLSSFAYAGDAGSECDTRMQGDRYYGAFRTCLKTRTLELEDLDAAIASDQPYYPARVNNPRTKFSAAKTLFTALTSDPGIRTTWADTKARLRDLRAELTAEEGVRRDASRDTRRILSPRLIATPDMSAGLKWTRLPDGRVAVLSRPDLKTVLISTPNGDKIDSIELDEPFQNWNLSWHRDAHGALWIYASGQANESTWSAWRLFRHKMGASQGFEAVELPGSLFMPRELLSAGPGYMLISLQDGEVWNLEDATPRRLVGLSVLGPGSVAVDRTGKLHAAAHESLYGAGLPARAF